MDAFRLNHRQAGVDRLDFSSKLFLGYGPRIRLYQNVGEAWINRYSNTCFTAERIVSCCYMTEVEQHDHLAARHDVDWKK
jgi:hypothetical protein